MPYVLHREGILRELACSTELRAMIEYTVGTGTWQESITSAGKGSKKETRMSTSYQISSSIMVSLLGKGQTFWELNLDGVLHRGVRNSIVYHTGCVGERLRCRLYKMSCQARGYSFGTLKPHN